LTEPRPQALNDLRDLRRRYAMGEVSRTDLRSRFMASAVELDRIQQLIHRSAIQDLRLDDDGMTLGFRSGVRLIWSPDDTGSAASIAFCHGDYEPDETRLLTRLATGKSTVLDIGANIGWFSLHLSAVLTGAEARIHAFEPVSETWRRLVANVALNGLGGKVRAHRLAVSDRLGDLELIVPGSVPGAASMLDLHPDIPSAAERAATVSLDHFLEAEAVGHVDLVKCDVEGAELKVLMGAERLLTRDRPILLLELLRKWSRAFGYHPDDALHLLARHGYSCWAVGPGRLRPVTAITDETPETNFLFLTKGHAPERAILTREFGA
jgi:FkbM family methyltransferase